MSHDLTLTRPTGDGTGQSLGPESAPSMPPRRRLGNWQVPPGATEHFAPSVPSVPSTSAPDHYVPTASDLTLPYSEREARRMEWKAQRVQASEAAELSLLRRRLDDDPDNVDVALELALALQESGESAEASSILSALHAFDVASGAHDDASQIRRLLGHLVSADTGRVATTDIGASATAEIRDAASAGVTAALAAVVGQTTIHLPTRSAPLNESVSAWRDGRRRPTTVELLPRDQFLLTDPELLMDALSREGEELLASAEAERAGGHLRAAIDTLTLAMATSPEALGLWIRMAEIRLQLGHRQKARSALVQLRALTGTSTKTIPSWMVERLMLHTGDPDVESLEQAVGLLVKAGQHRHAATYASTLIQLLDGQEQHEAAIDCASRMTRVLPGHTRVALESAILAARHASHGEVIDLWEAAVAGGVDAAVATASLAASVASVSEDDHWRLLAESLGRIRADPSSLCRVAYLRTAIAAGPSPVLNAGCALVLHAAGHDRAKDALADAANDRSGTSIGRAAASIALADRLSSAGKGDEYIDAVRTTLSLMANESIRGRTDWLGLTGVDPNPAELSTELGEALLEAGDAAGAVDVLRVWHTETNQHSPLVRLLAEAYVRTGQPGSALTLLDERGMHHRRCGQLDEMAAVLRQMSRVAPANLKVKTRLIDAYLQRGFVAEARAELIRRADLEELAGRPAEACKSLQRAADLSWSLGLMNEAFGIYDRLLTIDPDDVGHRTAVVNLCLQVGRLTEAAEHQRAIVDLALRHGRRREAIAALHQVIGLTPDDMTAYFPLGELLSSMGEYQQAE